MMDDVTQVAIEQGRQQADTVLEIRSRILEVRVAQAAEVDEVSPGASAEDSCRTRPCSRTRRRWRNLERGACCGG